MPAINLNSLSFFVNDNIQFFHRARLQRLTELKLDDLLKRKNPYLFKAKNITTAADLVSGLLDAFLSSSEEKSFGDFLEKLAIYVSKETTGGRKSSTPGLDLEFDRDGVRYVVAIKSGPSWGNKSQYHALEGYFRSAVKVLKQAGHVRHVQPVLGICYGKTRTSDNGLYQKLTGQCFWHFLSGDPDLYTDIVEPVGYKAKQHNDNFQREKSRVYNLFTKQFLDRFCPNGEVNWNLLVQFNSGNLREIYGS